MKRENLTRFQNTVIEEYVKYCYEDEKAVAAHWQNFCLSGLVVLKDKEKDIYDCLVQFDGRIIEQQLQKGVEAGVIEAKDTEKFRCARLKVMHACTVTDDAPMSRWGSGPADHDDDEHTRVYNQALRKLVTREESDMIRCMRRDHLRTSFQDFCSKRHEFYHALMVDRAPVEDILDIMWALREDRRLFFICLYAKAVHPVHYDIHD